MEEIIENVNQDIEDVEDVQDSNSGLTESFDQILSEITKTINQLYPGPEQVAQIDRNRQEKIIHCIESIMVNLAEALDNNEIPTITLKPSPHWKHCIVVNERLVLKPANEIPDMHIDPTNKLFSLIIWIMSTVHKLLSTNTFCTRRELFYQNLDKVTTQYEMNNVILKVTNILKVPFWDLNITSVSNGLVSGDVQFVNNEGVNVDCKIKGGVMIPQYVMHIQEIISSAKFILVVEKDTVFQNLLTEGFLDVFPNAILLTGKGFPDMNTRLFLKRLWITLKIPIFIMTDADPSGIDIMCTYRFGSMASAQLSEYLAIPSAKWIGIHPSDIKRLNIKSMPLSPNGQKKLLRMLKRPYMNESLQLQIICSLEIKEKAEIEAVVALGYGYLLNVYLPNKITSLEII